ncbi:MAG: hypothetical protein KC621_04745 [Myxococcales bacterium]|nr:hypothetical protein [Myxococcales bacterium]
MWVGIGSVTVALLVAAALTVAAGSWLSDVPRRPVGFGSTVALITVALLVAMTTAVVGASTHHTYGEPFPFQLVVPDGYEGELVLELCEGGPTDPLPAVIEVPDDGIVALGPVYELDPYAGEVVVRRRSGAPAQGLNTTWQTTGAAATWCSSSRTATPGGCRRGCATRSTSWRKRAPAASRTPRRRGWTETR